MKTFEIQVRVRFKEGILDPQAESIFKALQKLQFSAVKDLRCERLFVVKVEAEDSSQALEMGREMARKLLANVVMESFEVELNS